MWEINNIIEIPANADWWAWELSEEDNKQLNNLGFIDNKLSHQPRCDFIMQFKILEKCPTRFFPPDNTWKCKWINSIYKGEIWVVHKEDNYNLLGEK